MKPRRGRKRLKKKKEKEESSSILLLPADIVIHILLLLPIKYRIRCSMIFKTWRDIIRLDPRLTLQTPNFNTLIIESMNDIYMVDLDLQLAGQEDGVMKFKKPKNLNLQFLGSANGFICFFDFDTIGRYYLCNPVTGEFLESPDHNYSGQTHYDTAFRGFCYEPKSNHHVVIDITKERGLVYTFETNKWLLIKEAGFPLPVDRYKFFSVALNSVFHWLISVALNADQRRRDPLVTICALDMEKKTTRLMEVPPKLKFAFHIDLTLGVHADRLYICNNRPKHAEIWVLNSYGVSESWTKEIVIKHVAFPKQLRPAIYSIQVVLMLNSEHVLINHKGNEYMVIYNIVERKVTHTTNIRTTIKFEGCIHQVSFTSLPKTNL